MSANNITLENNKIDNKPQPMKRMVAMVPLPIHKELSKMVIDRGAKHLGEIITMLYNNFNQKAA